MSQYATVIHQIDRGPLAEGLALLPAKMTSQAARAQLLKTALQESRGVHRRQIGGPALGLWQFELGAIHGHGSNGKEWGLFVHPATRDHLIHVAEERGVRPTPVAIHRALEHDDVLAAAVARLNYWWVPAPMPDPYNEPGSWHYYNSTWAPGKPHRHTWPQFHREVLDYLSCHR